MGEFFSKFNMKIYKDVFSGDELFSDTYPMSLKNNVMYEIIGKYETRKEGEEVMGYLEENDRAAEIEEFKTNINGVMKELMGSFKDLQFFSGESMDPDAMIAMCEYKDVDGNGVEKQVFIFFKHGLEEEKV